MSDVGANPKPAGVASIGYKLGASPVNNVELVSSPGVATTFLRSDVTLALDQSISPTMTGNWTFTPGSGVAIVVNEVVGSDGVQIFAGSGSATDRSLNVVFSGHYNLLNVFNDGHGLLGFNGSANTITWAATGAVAIASPPTAVTALTINGASSATIALLNGANAAGGIVTFQTAGVSYADIGTGVAIAAGAPASVFAISARAGNTLYLCVDGGNPAIQIAQAGNITVVAPSSGTAVAISANDNTSAMLFNEASATDGYYIGFEQVGSLKGLIGVGPICITGATVASTNLVAGIASASDFLNFSANGGSSIQMQLAPAGLTINTTASNNQGLSILGNFASAPVGFKVVNSATGASTAATGVFDMGDGINFLTLQFQNAGNTANPETGGPTGLSGLIGTNFNGPLSLFTNGVEQMRILGGGGVVHNSISGVTSLQVNGGLARPVTATKTANYTMLVSDTYLIFNGSASITLTLLSASSFPGREVLVKTIAAETVVSASSNVRPISSATAGTAILAATAGAWALLVSDGTDWVIMANGT
jgi:hypothetical protein